MISVGFSTASGVFPYILRKATGRPYSHTWLLLQGADSLRGTDVVIESNARGGLHVVPWEGYASHKKVLRIVAPERSLAPGLDLLMAKLGTEYDMLGLVGQGWVKLFQYWMKRKVRNPLSDPKKLWCSEAVAFVLEKSGYAMPPGYWVDCEPSDVENIIDNKPLEL